MITSVGVVVPAANEQGHISVCLAAILAARRHAIEVSSRPIAVRVIVVLDSCDDDTAALVSAHPEIESISCAFGNVGASRGAGVAHLLATTDWGMGGSPEQIWVANTDADSAVPKTWLTQMLRHADDGADLVLGTVIPDGHLLGSVRQHWLRRHMAIEEHPHVHGANFGIRGSAYVRLGGWPLLATGEDVELAARAVECRLSRVVRTASLPVVTSSRSTGRAPLGFAHYLGRLAVEVAGT
ncbi:glycosyl transferase family 2 [Jatrophihabitans sp. GAS493]|uniref:glycosyltransferase n=1 Tax=Jatrophihabitans sp. GAS493 TaxID=1907575 RepID=UPI000BBF4084|nr:glycosyltransferase family A protein [Jatrophihabitans sp. GAS493]SOD74925.1 glycosyl transferase family 2 [Jatrophihabitans sp. GAS493]